ncbi:MAG: hypothetical protein ACYDDF_15195 [Thermoplasmatota archaeon]
MTRLKRIRAPPGFIWVRTTSTGRWVIMAGYPETKIDNTHRDALPHLHDGGLESAKRRPLRPDLTQQEAIRAIVTQLTQAGSIDIDTLVEELS